MAFEHFGLCLFTFDNCHFKLEETFLHCLPQRWSFGCCSFLNLLFDAQSSQVSFTDIFTALLGQPLSEPPLSQEDIHVGNCNPLEHVLPKDIQAAVEAVHLEGIGHLFCSDIYCPKRVLITQILAWYVLLASIYSLW